MSPTNDCIYSYILIFITVNSNAKHVEIVKILSKLKIRSSKSIAMLWLKVRLQIKSEKESIKTRAKYLDPGYHKRHYHS